MGKKIGFFHRAIDGVETVLYGTAATAGGLATTALVSADAALLLTGVGVVALPFTLPVTAAFAYGTMYAGSKTYHKAHHVAGVEHDDHSLRNAAKPFKALF